MLIIGVLLNIAGLGIFCWALFALATHALPFFVGMTVGIYSLQAGAGPFGAIVAGFMMAGFALVVGQYAFSVTRSPVLRLVIGLLFALPAARAGYHATLALAKVGVEGSSPFARSRFPCYPNRLWAFVGLYAAPKDPWRSERGADGPFFVRFPRPVSSIGDVNGSRGRVETSSTAASGCAVHFNS